MYGDQSTLINVGSVLRLYAVAGQPSSKVTGASVGMVQVPYGGGSTASKCGSESGGGSKGLLSFSTSVSTVWGFGKGGGLLGLRGVWQQPVRLLLLQVVLQPVALTEPLLRLL